MWKKVKGQRSSKEFNPPAPQTDSTEDAEGALKRSKRVLGIRSRIDKSKKPFQHVQQPENKSKATEVLLSRSGLGKSAMFTMTFLIIFGIMCSLASKRKTEMKNLLEEWNRTEGKPRGIYFAFGTEYGMSPDDFFNTRRTTGRRFGDRRNFTVKTK